jgi:hypothetical protein
VWFRCDECDTPYFIGAVMNPRNHKWRPIPLSLAPDSVVGNFRIDWDQDSVEVFQFDGVSLGPRPIVVYAVGAYIPHSPSHFLDDVHGEHAEHSERWTPKTRLHNFKLAMEDNET